MAEQATIPATGFNQLNPKQKISVAVGAAALIALLASVWMWGQTPDYRVLYSNVSDRDGGAIIESLQQLNVPYKFTEGGGAVMVPSNLVYETRLKLATQGLPKGGTVGFELMENQKFGISQFAEQVNYQRALEGELARSVQSIAAVASARVHLAIPKPTVFVKEQQKPSASVVLTLNAGRSLDPAQVSAIVHLISSSVPEMSAKNVTVVDQSGTLLSTNPDGVGNEGLDASQLKYVRQIEQNYVQRVEAIVAPIVGEANVRAQVTADIDFSQTEQTAETYKPNQDKADSTVRSLQTVDSTNGTVNAGGVPGALSNQPPVPATAPIVAAANSATNPAVTPTNPAVTPTNAHKESTVNYEVDRTISHTKLPVGMIKRLSVAVVVNNRKITDAKGKVSFKPLTEAEKTQINDLVRDAMGFDANRGDTLNVQNAAFNVEKEVVDEIPLWKQPDMVDLGKDIAKYLLIALVMLIVVFGIIKPALRPLLNTPEHPKKDKLDDEGPAGSGIHITEDDTFGAGGAELPQQPVAQPYEQGLRAAQQIAQDDPRIVASVLKDWVNGNE
jgi:flagellar M-ring protein FliF